MIPATHGHPRFQSYVLPELQPAAATCHAQVIPYWTSQTLLLDLARPLTRLLHLRGAVNLLAVGLICCVIASAAIACLVVAVRAGVAVRVAAAAVTWLIVADSAYFDYFASPLGEGTGVLGILLVCAGIPLLGRGLRTGLPGLVLVGSGGMLAVGAKTQLLVLAAPIVLVLLLRTVALGRTRGRLVKRLAPRSLGAVAAVCVIAVAGLSYRSHKTYDTYVRMNPVDTIFSGIVDGRHDTRADLAFLGLPPQWAKYAGTNWWTNNQAFSRDPFYRRYESKLTLTNTCRFWVTHPGRTVAVLQARAQQLLGMRPTYLGSYMPSAHLPPGAQEHRLELVSSAARSVRTAGLFLLVPAWTVTAWCGVRCLRRGRRPGGRHLDRSLGTVVLFLEVCAVSQFVMAALGEAMENEKHMVFAAFCTLMLCPVLLVAAARNSRAAQAPLLLRRAIARRHTHG
ncbi:hypothetical protein ACH4UM_00340 [Streptomyces sp. NPDC020801]|uniref:glycan biosynthesis hexose transferase WsfD n=1 Tax=unclassified Streptomyces TaxID=2593676 RepID=UPI00378BA64E